MNFDTKVLHSYPVIDSDTGAASIPKYQSSTFHQKNFPDNQEYTYTRFGNPTVEAAEKAVAALENAKFGIAFSSGMAAITASLLVLNSGDHLVLGKNIYGGTFQLLTELLNRFNVTYTFVDERHPSAWEEAIRSNTKLFYLETPSNPLLTVTNIQEVCKIAKTHKLLTVCDNTFMTPYYQQPLTLGADIVIHSATKFLGGHSDIVMGFAVTNNEEFKEKLRKNQKIIGSIPGIEEAWLLLRGIKTLAVRMKQASCNALILANRLQTLTKVTAVHYPGLENHPDHLQHFKQATNGGAVLSFELDAKEQVHQLFQRVKIPIVAVSLGGVESILSYPWTMSHACMSESDRLKAGVTPKLVRLSCGIEDVDDLWVDIQQALEGEENEEN
ncbi:trans-sulfuration enzyme family protein [Candidatus Enterococcus ferrettii]|uniref:cysteine-S-conjugate beta-lyase n=1 Tax=Candidatus Enterococcus ferrettii TaxID=2815324 RepID=A0ABV0EQ45_9ENTE|nr:PLP-dependent aspartate aminotransferase family protein [Enterococcus sp. 665A]MBO1339303.1 PLP-dependent transferase [Enterococcus sp. 665A]